MPHRVGIIGLGTVGSRFVDQFNRHPGFELVAAWDHDGAALTRHAESVWIADEASGVIAAAEVVYIAVPPLFHAGYVEACVEAGTGIFCEKPLGVDGIESRALVERVERSGLPAGVNFVYGAAPAAVDLLRAISGREIGDVVRADLRLHHSRWPREWHAAATWLAARDQGGWVREVTSHFLFLAGRALGPLGLESSAVVYPDGPDGALAETDAFARFTGAVAPMVMFGTSTGVGPDVVDFTIRGTEGSLRLVDWYRLQRTDGDGWVDVLGADRAELAAAAYRSQLDELALMLEGAPTRIATFAEALAVQELVEALLATHPEV